MADKQTITEAFLERVAIMIHDGKLSEREAIGQAYVLTRCEFAGQKMPKEVEVELLKSKL